MWAGAVAEEPEAPRVQRKLSSLEAIERRLRSGGVLQQLVWRQRVTADRCWANSG